MNRSWLPCLAREGLDESGRIRSLAFHPFPFVVGRMGIVEYPVGEFVEGRDIPGLSDPEAPDEDAVEHGLPFRILVPPGDIVLGAGRVDGDVVPGLGEPLGDEAAMELRASHDLLAVALDDERDPPASWDELLDLPEEEAPEVHRPEPLEPAFLALDDPLPQAPRRPATRATSSATRSGRLVRTRTPAPSSVNGTAAASKATMGRSKIMLSTSGRQKPSCSLIERKTSEARYRANISSSGTWPVKTISSGLR